ncbi:aminotransferase class I/II-fold pyridoxal phosphate-dependent enzyme [Pedobacter sp. MC2016-15]|uniref:pyridoxal phosphate-dependent aminotransferase n=1 Tax=Pedobacter sp. MC2016-15 TaxID=2994473 RepID=UPI0022454E19|nr:aminotransferase class I/II-fold pyridoxal phosphate-dependent enzyme [Pedobacter sp. MC2016-15]MCX2478412.1 aminotransferase class I/II-fold pyridoxal phosphate-dependent enzyme [Pedobacter sp. MC2016-15]
MSVSVLAKSLIGSEIIKIGQEVNELKSKGAKIANLTIGDFDPSIFPIPSELKDEIVNAYNEHHTNYPPADGVLSLRKTVAGILKDRYELDFNTDEILVSGGSRPLIYATYLALVDPGDKVIYPAPSWNNNHYCHLSSAEGIAVETTAETNFMPTAELLRPHIKGATLLALCSPLNPTGTMFSKEQLEEICDMVIEENKSRAAGEKPLYIMYDQIYSLLTFGKEHINPVSLRPELRDYVVYIDGISKCLAATGVRVGWGFGPAEVVSKMKALLTHIGAWAPKAEQVAVAKYFADKALVDQFMDSFKEQIQESLNALYVGFQQLKSEGFAVDAIVPMGAIYLTLKIDYIGKTTASGDLLKDSTDVNSYLINEALAAFVPFSCFGTDETKSWFRASVGGCSLEDINAMIPRIKAALSKLK